MSSEKTNQSWGGRFSEPVDAFVARFTASVDFDKRLYRHDIMGSIAHATMLAKVGVLALIATPVAGLLGMLIAWLVVRKLKRGNGLLDFLGMLGLAVPGTVVGIGYAIAFNTPLQDIPIDRRVGPTEQGVGIFDHFRGEAIKPSLIQKYPSSSQKIKIIKG